MSTPAYTPPTSFTQVAVTKEVHFPSLCDALNSTLGNENKDLEISLVGPTGPPYSPSNVGTLTVAAPGRVFTLEQVKEVLEAHEVPAPAEAPTQEPAPEPTVVRDPALDPAPAEEPTEEPPAEEPAAEEESTEAPAEEPLPDDDNPPAEEPLASRSSRKRK